MNTMTRSERRKNKFRVAKVEPEQITTSEELELYKERMKAMKFQEFLFFLLVAMMVGFIGFGIGKGLVGVEEKYEYKERPVYIIER